jgi:hypothetical protein
MVHVCSFMMLEHISRSWKLTMGIRRKSHVLIPFSPNTIFWDLKFATPVQLHQCRSAMQEIKLRKNYHCLFHVYWSTKLSLPLITGLAPTSWGAVCQWKLWWQHDSLAGWVMTTFPSSHLSEASCCLIWKGHRYGHLWFTALVLFLQWGHQAVRKLGFH